MHAFIDRFGRMVIPQQIRLRLGLKAGSELNVEESQDGILIRPASQSSPLIRKGSLLVHTGRPIGSQEDVVRKDREARIRKVGGLDK